MKRPVYNYPTSKQYIASTYTYTIAIHNKQHSHSHTKSKTGLQRATTIRNHAIRFNVPYKPLPRMDRRQTVVNVTCEVSPKHNNQFRCRLVTYIYVTGTNIPYSTKTNKFTYQHISHRTKTTRVQKQQQAPPLHNLVTNDLHISIHELHYYVSLFTIHQPPWQHLRLPTIL
jgi:hypothetical protein